MPTYHAEGGNLQEGKLKEREQVMSRLQELASNYSRLNQPDTPSATISAAIEEWDAYAVKHFAQMTHGKKIGDPEVEAYVALCPSGGLLHQLVDNMRATEGGE
jgi:hypothetical protein